MLSDAIREARKELAGYLGAGIEADPVAVAAAMTVLDTWAIEAANMETRLRFLGRGAHAPFAPPGPARPHSDGGAT